MAFFLEKYFPGGRAPSRADRKASGRLGVVNLSSTLSNDDKIFRSKELEILDAYFESRQYDHLTPWDQAKYPNGEYIPIRNRRPRMVVAFAKTLMSRLTTKVMGGTTFPTIALPESPDDQEFLRAVVRETGLETALLEPMRRLFNGGSTFVRYYLVDGTMKVEWYHSKYCYPVFQQNDELESIKIRYVYTDKEDLDDKGNYKQKWYQLELFTDREVLYDNPDYSPGVEPTFQPVETVQHDLGFVQGRWFRTCKRKDSPDGYGLTEDITDFIDEICYSLSQSSQAVGYNQDPQLTTTGIDEDEVETLIRSAQKSWNLGRQGKAEFLESNLGGVERAIELRDKVRVNIQDVSRIALLDPDKLSGTNVQSGKALEILHGPLKELVDELRAIIQKDLKLLVIQMATLILVENSRGKPVPIVIPDGYVPTTFDFKFKWSPLFQQTMSDLKEKVGVAVAATSANILSRETALRWVAEDFNVDDIEAELARIAAQPVINPFGGF